MVFFSFCVLTFLFLAFNYWKCRIPESILVLVLIPNFTLAKETYLLPGSLVKINSHWNPIRNSAEFTTNFLYNITTIYLFYLNTLLNRPLYARELYSLFHLWSDVFMKRHRSISDCWAKCWKKTKQVCIWMQRGKMITKRKRDERRKGRKCEFPTAEVAFKSPIPCTMHTPSCSPLIFHSHVSAYIHIWR